MNLLSALGAIFCNLFLTDGEAAEIEKSSLCRGHDLMPPSSGPRRRK